MPTMFLKKYRTVQHEAPAVTPLPKSSTKLLHVIPSFDPVRGGPVAGIRQASSALRDLGVHQSVASGIGNETADAPLIDYYGIGQARGRFQYNPELAAWLKKHVGEYDVVSLHHLWEHAILAGWRAARKSGTPYVVYCHGMLDPYFKRKFRQRVEKTIVWKLYLRRILTQAAYVLFTTETELEAAKAAYPDMAGNFKVVRYGARRVDKPSNEAVTEQRTLLKLSPGPVALFIGRINPKKGLLELIQAMAIVKRQIAPDLILIIAGSGDASYEDEVKQAVETAGLSSNVRWVGHVDGVTKDALFFAADLFVLPSYQENFGVAVAEAMSAGLPVVITQAVNISAAISAAGAGEIIASPAVPDIVSGLRRTLQMNSEEIDSMGVRGQRLYEELYSIESAASDLANTANQLRTRS